MISATTPHTNPLTERRFGERLRLREPEALERFFDLFFAPVYGRVRKLVGSSQEAEDLTQDIFLKIHGALYSRVLTRLRDNLHPEGARP